MQASRLDKLFRAHHKALYATALALTRNREAAEDAVHDALIAVAESTTRPDDLKAYLFRAVRNRALHYRRVLQASGGSGDEADYLISPPGGEEAVFAAQVMRHLETLSEDERGVIILKLFAGCTFAEIADQTENPANTVASWYRRGLLKLKEAFDARG